jgi:hypothetical protein
MDNITQNGGGYHSSLSQGKYIYEGLLGNKVLQWETAQKYNLGLDFQILNDLTGAIDVFRENRSEILISRRSIPTWQGMPLGNIPKVNMGEVLNRGFEVELTYTKQLTADLLVSARGNFGYNHNKRQNVDEVPRDDTYAYPTRETGYPIGQNFGYEIDYAQDGGYWLEETLTDPNRFQPQYTFGTPREGDFVYVDKNNDGIIDEKDQAPLGFGGIPRITWGASVSAQYKGFDCYIFFQGLSKYNEYHTDGVRENSTAGVYYDYHRTAWTRERWNNGEEITYPALSTGQTTNHISNSFFVLDRSFVRFKNAEIGYTLPANLLKMVGISKMRVFITGQNICIWSPKFRTTHLDPEINSSSGYPTTRSFGFGANITF